MRNLADILRLAFEAQFQRLTQEVPGGPFDADHVPWMQAMVQRGIDFDLFVVALARFQRLAEWTLEGAFVTGQLKVDVANFAATVPDLIAIRDTQEHFDEYQSNVGWRQQKGEPPAAIGHGMSPAGGIITYGPFMLSAAAALAAAQELHRAIRRDVDPIALQDVHGGPDSVLIPHP